MKNLVEVQNLKKNYGSKEAVKNISFEIKENEILGLLGPNGCGKTTTIGMMLGLLKPSNGEIYSQTISPICVTSNMRPQRPAQINVFPLSRRSHSPLDKVNIESGSVYSHTNSGSSLSLNSKVSG